MEILSDYIIYEFFDNTKVLVTKLDGTIITNDIYLEDEHLSSLLEHKNKYYLLKSTDLEHVFTIKLQNSLKKERHFKNKVLHNILTPACRYRYNSNSRFYSDYYVNGLRYDKDEFDTDLKINKLRRLEKLNRIFNL